MTDENHTPDSSLTRRPPHPSLVACAGLGALILVAFGASHNYALLNYDENFFILQDHAIRAIEWERISFIFRTNYEMAYNPLVRISYMLDYALWGTDPAGYRGTNFLLHWIAAWCLFGFIYSLTRQSAAAWLTALCFALHPSRVESVVWLGERKDVLAAAFGFAALWLYVKAKGERQKAKGKSSESEVEEDSGQTAETQNSKLKTQNSEGNSQLSTLNYTLCVLLYAGAMASKPQWVPLCAVFVVIDLYERRPLTRLAPARYVPFFLLSGLFAIYAMESQHVGNNTLLKSGVPLWLKAANPLVDITWYLGHLLYPVNLLPYYQRTLPGAAQIALACLVVVASMVGVVLSWRQNREVFLGLSWFFLFLSPMLNLIPRGLVPADRYLYVSLVGVVFPLGMWLSRQRRPVVVGVLCLVSVAMISLTWRYLPVWQDDHSLWAYTVQRNPNNAFALAGLLDAQTVRGEYRAAEQTYQLGLNQPQRFAALYAAASKLARKTHNDAGEPFRKGLESYPNSVDLMGLYGHYWLEEKNFAEAERWLLESYSKAPTYQVAADLARVSAETTQAEKGLPLILLALNKVPYNAEYWTILGKLQERGGHLEEAKNSYLLSVQLDGSLLEPRLQLARLACRRQAWSEAESWLTALQHSSNGSLSAEGFDLLAIVYQHQGKMPAALAALTRAVQLQDVPSYWIHLAHLQAETGRDPRKAIEHILVREPQRRAELMVDPVLAPFLKG